MEPSVFRRFLAHVADTRDAEIACAECFELISRYVDLELGGNAAERMVSGLKHHLDQCRVCREEYEVLRDLVRAEGDGSS